ncbi:MAG: bifunctional phosphoglucose/phosphomannose isomerase, partial [Candidatus Glassbacteria bacterium RBG_16_58_8]
SAIAGDILRDYVAGEMTAPFRVIRGYTLPPNEGRLLFIASSYSGNTEEIMALLRQAKERDADIYTITSGGALQEEARTHGYPLIPIPPGYPPRGALGYSFVSLLYLLRGFYPGVDVEADVEQTSRHLEHLAASYAEAGEGSPPFRAAREIAGKIPVIYAPSHLESVAVRWKGQLSENAKVLAFVGIVPEMNHNEICGWQNVPEALKKFYAIFLRDEGEHQRIGLRMGITRELVEPFAGGITEVRTTGKSLLERIFSLIYFGDFVSLYLSLILEVDPMPVGRIDELKRRLAQFPQYDSP